MLLLVQWRHFSSVVDRFKTTYVEFLQDSVYQKLFKSVYFLRNYSKNKNVATFLGHTVHCEIPVSAASVLDKLAERSYHLPFRLQ